MPRRLPRTVYRISWALIFAQLVFAISVIAAEFLYSYSHILPNDEWPFYLWPVGIWAGWRFADRSLHWRRFHIACLIAGGCLTPICFSIAVTYHLRAEALRGTGFLAGLGEAITAAMYLFMSVATLCLFTAGATNTFNGWRFSLRTLLVVTTIVAAILSVIVPILAPSKP
jgi:hypothetical protein